MKAKSYLVSTGCMGLMSDGKYYLFATEEEYLEAIGIK